MNSGARALRRLEEEVRASDGSEGSASGSEGDRPLDSAIGITRVSWRDSRAIFPCLNSFLLLGFRRGQRTQGRVGGVEKFSEENILKRGIYRR